MAASLVSTPGTQLGCASKSSIVALTAVKRINSNRLACTRIVLLYCEGASVMSFQSTVTQCSQPPTNAANYNTVMQYAPLAIQPAQHTR